MKLDVSYGAALQVRQVGLACYHLKVSRSGAGTGEVPPSQVRPGATEYLNGHVSGLGNVPQKVKTFKLGNVLNLGITTTM